MKKTTRRSAIGLPFEEGLTTSTVGNFTTKFSLSSFLKRVEKLNNEQRNLIEKTGFGNLLLLPNQKLNKNLLAEMMELWDCEKGAFLVTPDQRELRISLLDVGLILGLPMRGNPVILEENLPFSELESEYKSVSGKRHMTVASLEKRLDSIGKAADENFVRTFLLLTFGTILFPNKGEVDSRYLHYLEDLDAVSGFSWGEAVLEDVFIWLNKWKEMKMEFMGGCLTLLLIWCYEHVNIERPNLVDSGLIFPRACRWESSSIRSFHRRKWFNEKFVELQDDQITWKLEPTHAELQVNIIKDFIDHCGEANELSKRRSSSSGCSIFSVVEGSSNSATNTSADQVDHDCTSVSMTQHAPESPSPSRNVSVTQHAPDSPSSSRNVSVTRHVPDFTSSPGNLTTSSNEDYLILENQKLVEQVAQLRMENAQLKKLELENVELKKELKTLRRDDLLDRLDRILLGEDLNDSDRS